MLCRGSEMSPVPVGSAFLCGELSCALGRLGWFVGMNRSVKVLPVPQELRTLGICLVPFHLPCQQPTSCRPCTPSPQSCKDWQWSSSGCTGTLTCTVGTYPVRKIITGESAKEAFGDLGIPSHFSTSFPFPSGFFPLVY